MPSNARQQPLYTRLYQNDIVHKIGSENHHGIVLRCWHDPEDIPPQASLADPLLRPLKKGEVGVSWISPGQGNEILSESQLKLIDRCMQPGDYCKRSVDDMRSGVVTAVHVQGQLAHVISGEPVEGWKTSDDLQDKPDAEVGDCLVYDDWVGQVIEVFDESIVDASGKLVRLPELGSRLAIGDEGTDILPPPTHHAMQTTWRSLWGSQSPTPGTSKDKVIGVKHTVYAVAWLALNQMLDPAVAESKTRPQRFWSAKELDKLTVIRGRVDIEMRVGDKVYLKDITGLPVTEHGNESDPAGVVHVHTYKVVQTVTMLDVTWQDGVREKVRSTNVVPYVSPDEHDCWPGDHVLWKNEDVSRFAVVQSVNPIARTASVRLEDTNTNELVSVLELDPNGNSEAMQGSTPPLDGLGVRRGDFVFIHKEGTTNGSVKPRVPRIGELEPWVREVPSFDFTGGWRLEMEDIGHKLAADTNTSDYANVTVKRPVPGDASLHWIGEVTELRLDGSIEVTHPDWTVKAYPLERLTRLYDGMEQLEDEAWDDDIASNGYEDDRIWTMGEDGQWFPEDSDTGNWEDVENFHTTRDDEDAMDVDPLHWNEENAPSPENTTQPTTPDNVPTPVPDAPSPPVPPLTIQSAPRPTPLHIPEDSEHWTRFETLSSAPVDHAYYATVPTQPSKAFLGRLQREYRALSSSLPHSILVRVYEDRADLLRCLIIGPENTPYQDAPFVIDWMLDSNFPHSPPIAHFLSWTNGNGRVNPNLYEEGKVCLSILGTWVGEQSETWSSSRSSLLQAFVSIQGLVLVKEPWFCEPAFDKLRGTEEGTINSRLYNEKAFVLSRGFVRRALEIPLGGLEKEIDWLYYTNGGLEKVLQDSRQLIEASKSHSEVSLEDMDLAVPRLTEGGIITLERTLQKLQGLHDRRQNKVHSSS